MPYAKISSRTLDTACRIKEEPNIAQRRVPPYRNRTWSLSHHLAAAWGNEEMHRHQKCAHFLRSHPAHDISNRTDCVSRFESKSFLENILESNAGGRGTPRKTCQSAAQCARTPLGLIRHAIYPSEPIAYRGSNLSPFLRISWNQMPGGGGWRQSAARGRESDRLSLLFSCSGSRHCRVR
jgi:hypothetical protein